MIHAERDILLQKLDEFIRKYYTNLLIRGLLLTGGILIAFYLALALLEYYGQFDTALRTALFYSFVGLSLFVLIRMILLPILKLNRLGEVISHEEASSIIGKHFTDVQDKLLNVLQLQQAHLQPESMHASAALLEAGIRQKIRELKPIPFVAAIDLRENRRYAKYLAVPMLLLLLIAFFAPRILSDSTERLLHHRTYFEKRAPFSFHIENEDLKTPQLEDFLVQVRMEGEELPEAVFIRLDGNEYKLNRDGKSGFSYLFRNVQKNISFQLLADGFSSREYELLALPKPTVLDFSLSLDYPDYIGKKDEILKNTGDLLLPAGTKVTWTFQTQNASELKLSLPDTIYHLLQPREGMFSASHRFLQNQAYAISVSNEFLPDHDSVRYAVNVIPDQFPTITMEEKRDSASLKQYYYAGSIRDDYGFSRLTFNYRFLAHYDSSGESKGSSPLQSFPVPISRSITSQTYYHFWDLTDLAISPGDEIEYYFEIWDNDAVNGSKSSRTPSRLFRAPSLAEIAANTEKNNEEIKKEMENSIRQTQELQKDMEALYKKILEKKNLTWEEKKKLEDLVKEQKELEQKIEQIKKQNEENNRQQTEFAQPNHELQEKQQQLQELMEQVMTDEMKKMFEEMQKLLEKMDKNKIQEMMEKMQLSNKDMEKELDRTLELFKKMELEQKMQQTIDKLTELAKEQDELANQSMDKKTDEKELKKQQDSLNKKFDDIKKDLQDLDKKNSELEEPQNMPDTKEEQKETQQEMQNSSDQLNQGQKKNASQSQKKASQKMNQMAQKMQSSMNQSGQEQQEEDEHALRDILHNLLQLSFDQEALMKELEKIRPDNPQYTRLSQQQKKLKDDSKMIEDSLLALSKRQPMIASAVNREIAAINTNMDKSIFLMSKREHRYTPEIASRQQFSMTSLNNLALMLNESLEQMQNASKKSGSCSNPGSCKKPGHGQKPSSATMKQMQEQIKKQMEALKKSMEKGDQKGGQQGAGGMSEQLVRIAAQQEALKNMMMQMQKEGGMNPGDMKNMMKMIEDSQKDVVNRMITQETLMRQEKIMEKLLDFEKAEKERETEQKRQAEQVKNDPKRNLSRFMEYNQLKEKEVELLKTVPPSFKNYYKNKVSEYFNKFAKE